jgi:hypothetical protein
MPMLQNFSITRANDEAISVVVNTSVPNDTIIGATVEWSVYGMAFGVPIDSPQLILKSSDDGGVTVPGSPDMFFIINLNAVDTRDLDLGNYYHEALVVDEVGNRATIMYGAVALTLSVE